jgi:hypothetical protein
MLPTPHWPVLGLHHSPRLRGVHAAASKHRRDTDACLAELQQLARDVSTATAAAAARQQQRARGNKGDAAAAAAANRLVARAAGHASAMSVG